MVFVLWQVFGNTYIIHHPPYHYYYYLSIVCEFSFTRQLCIYPFRAANYHNIAHRIVYESDREHQEHTHSKGWVCRSSCAMNRIYRVRATETGRGSWESVVVVVDATPYFSAPTAALHLRVYSSDASRAPLPPPQMVGNYGPTIFHFTPENFLFQFPVRVCQLLWVIFW